MVKLVLFLLPVLLSHPVHVSMSSLYEDEAGEYRLTVRMYTDDLNLDLYRLYNAEGEYNENDHMFYFTGHDSVYTRYINDNLAIIVNDEPAGKELMEKEVLDLETLFHFRVNLAADKIKKIVIKNKILTGLYPDQVNLFIFKLNANEKGVKFTKETTEESFVMDD